jgi:iron complex transport system ATP-binding protein
MDDSQKPEIHCRMKNDDAPMAIRITGLKVGYEGTHGELGFSREAINYTACGGEMIALIGPNGIGKSTLLRTMAGFQKSWQGNILYHGKAISQIPARELSKMLSFVSTESIHVANLRVADLVAYGRFPYTGWLGRLSSSDQERVMDALEKVGLTKFARRMVSQLSDGERQRALIARALTQDTPFILLDEPTAFLDVKNKYEIFHLLHQLARQNNKTIILSTHDLNIALREMDKFWIMLENESLEGSPEDAVLNGWLDRLFSTGNVAFDTNSGDFYFQKDHAGTASVKGEEPAYSWTIRALERKGYFFTTRNDADLKISISSDNNTKKTQWQVETMNNKWLATSLYELFNLI